MLVERKKNNQVVITISSAVDSFGLQRLIDYARYLDLTLETKASQTKVDDLSSEFNKTWWTKNKKKFVS
jgi:hypothetical protein